LSAVPLLEQAYELDGDDFNIQVSLFNSYEATNATEKSIVFAEERIAEDGDKYRRALWMQRLGTLWKILGDKKKAKKYYLSSLEIVDADHIQEELQELKKEQKRKQKSNVANVLFMGKVNYSSVSQLIKAVDKAVSEEPDIINLYISSRGGGLEAGVVAFNYLNALPVELRTINFNLIQSSANLLFCAGGKRTAVKNSSFLFHRVIYSSFRAGSSLDDIEVDSLQSGKLFENSVHKIMKTCMPSVSLDKIIDYYDDGYTFGEKEAKKMGLIESTEKSQYNLEDIVIVPKYKE